MLTLTAETLENVETVWKVRKDLVWHGEVAWKNMHMV
jgi:hypothetical protein